MSVVNPGELRDSLTVLVTANVTDENGFNVEGTQELFKLRCKKKTISTKEFASAGNELTELTYKFICRNRDIDTDMLIDYKGKIFNIKHIHEIDEHFIEITASEKR